MTDQTPAAGNTPQAAINWLEDGVACTARWRSERGASAPQKVVLADDRTTADAAYRLACEGTGLLWRGDFQNARQLLQALSRRGVFNIHAVLVQGQRFNRFQGLLRCTCNHGDVK